MSATRSAGCSAAAAWPRCTAAATCGSAARSPSRCCAATSRATPPSRSASAARRRPSASLNHPAIVAVYDTGEDRTAIGATPYIVMEYVEGETLRDVHPPRGPPLPRARDEPGRRHLRRPGLQPPQRHRAPRREARERDDHAPGHGQGDGLRHRPRRLRLRRDDDLHGRRHRHRPVPLPRAGPRRGRRRPLRRLLDGLPALRARHRRPAVHRRLPRRRGLPARPRGPAAAVVDQPARSRRSSTPSCSRR